MGLTRRPMDADERGTDGVNVEILVSNSPCQDTGGSFGGSPTD